MCPLQPWWLRLFALRTIWTQIQLDFEPNITRVLILPLPLKRHPFLLLSRCSLSLVSAPKDPDVAAAGPGSPKHGPQHSRSAAPQLHPARRLSTPLLLAGATLPRRAAPCSRSAGATHAPATGRRTRALPRPPLTVLCSRSSPLFDGQRAASLHPLPPAAALRSGQGALGAAHQSGQGAVGGRVPLWSCSGEPGSAAAASGLQRG